MEIHGEIHGKYRRGAVVSVRRGGDRDSRLNRPQIAVKKAKVGRVTFFPGREVGSPRFLFSFDYRRAARVRPSRVFQGERVGGDGGYRVAKRGVAEFRFRGTWRNNSAERAAGRAMRSPIIFSRWESIGPPTYAADVWQRRWRWSSTR